jgi:hypothetical protein
VERALPACWVFGLQVTGNKTLFQILVVYYPDETHILCSVLIISVSNITLFIFCLIRVFLTLEPLYIAYRWHTTGRNIDNALNVDTGNSKMEETISWYHRVRGVLQKTYYWSSCHYTRMKSRVSFWLHIIRESAHMYYMCGAVITVSILKRC